MKPGMDFALWPSPKASALLGFLADRGCKEHVLSHCPAKGADAF